MSIKSCLNAVFIKNSKTLNTFEKVAKILVIMDKKLLPKSSQISKESHNLVTLNILVNASGNFA